MIVCAWTRYPSPAALAVLSWYSHRLHYVGATDSDYFDFLAGWWASGEREIITLEHDIVPRRELIDEMRDCPRAWCGAMYPFEGTKLFGLGLTKFALEIRQALPNLFDLVAERSGQHHPPKHWCSLDSHIQALLNQKSGHTAHIHDHPEWIEHLSEDGAVKWRSHTECLVPV